MTMIEVRDVSKSFTLHQQGSTVIPVLEGGNLTIAPRTRPGYPGRASRR